CSCPAARVQAAPTVSSQRRVQKAVKILTQLVRIEAREPTPPFEQDLGLHARSTHRAKLGNRLA
ncbi:MAG: hypothetical protein ACNA8R_05545, partial [Nitriliruptoraceae bacterium]